MDLTTEGSAACSQGSSSNEYFTADEFWMDMDTNQRSSEPDKQPVRVLGIMEAIRNGLYATFDRSPKQKSVKGGSEGTVAAKGLSNTSLDHSKDSFSQEDSLCLDSDDLRIVSKGSLQGVQGLLPSNKSNVDLRSKQDLYDIRPVFGEDTRSFSRRSSSEQAIATKSCCGKARNRRQRMTWPIKPCESDIAIETKKQFTFTRDECVVDPIEDELMRTKSKSLVSEAVRKALSVVTVENVLQDSLLSYTDLQRGDIRLTSELVFWTEDLGTSFTGDATPETEKSKFVLTPYPKSKQQHYGETCENILRDVKIYDNFRDEVQKIESYEICEDEQFFDSSCLLPEDSTITVQACDNKNDTSETQKTDEDDDSIKVPDIQSIHSEADLPGVHDGDNVISCSFPATLDSDFTCDTQTGESTDKNDNDENSKHIGVYTTKSIETSDSLPEQNKEDVEVDDTLIAKDASCQTTKGFTTECSLQNDQVLDEGITSKENFSSANNHGEEIKAAEEIVCDTMKVARSVAHHVLCNEVRSSVPCEPQCWEDLLDLDNDDDVISLSDFDMNEIKLIKNELAEMRNTIGEVAQEIIKDKEDKCDETDEMISSQESYKLYQRNQQSVPKTVEGEEMEEGGDQGCNNSEEVVDDVRTKITFWEGVMKFGYDVTNKKVPSMAEKADRLVCCKFCKQVHQTSTPDESNDPSLKYSERWNNGRIVAVETKLSNVTKGLTYPDPRMINEDNEGKPVHSHEGPVSSDQNRLDDTKSASENLAEEKEEDEAEEGSVLPKVKTRISIWEKLPFRKGHLKKKPEESVDLDTSTKEKVAFFEQISTPQSPFSRKSSSRFSFMKDDWLQRFRNKHDESTATDLPVLEDSSFIQQPGGSYDSGMWTNAAFFDNSLLESIDDAIREKTKEDIDQEKGHFEGDDVESLNHKEFGSHCNSEDKNDSELTEAEKEEAILELKPQQLQEDSNPTYQEEGQMVMDSSKNISPSKLINDIHNESLISYCSQKMESKNTPHLSDGHEFFLEIIGENPVDVVEDTMSCNEKEDSDSFLEVEGSAIKYHEMPKSENEDVDNRSNAKPDIISKRKKSFLGFFMHRKNVKKDFVSSKSTEKCTDKANDKGCAIDEVDRKIAKKCKKKRSKDWGYVDVDPYGACIVQSKPKKHWKLFRKV